MRRYLWLLSLIAVLAGTPLRLAEAAHDLACSLAELDGGEGVEAPDGGIGDDSGATIKAKTIHALTTVESVDFLFTAEILWPALQYRANFRPRFATRHPHSLAWLQTFRC